MSIIDIETFFSRMVKGAKSELKYKVEETIQEKFSLLKLYLIYANHEELAWGIRWLKPYSSTISDIQKAIIAFVEFYTGIQYADDAIKVFDKADDEVTYVIQKRFMPHIKLHGSVIDLGSVDEEKGIVFITFPERKMLEKNANHDEVLSVLSMLMEWYAVQLSLTHLLPWVREMRETPQYSKCNCR
ncbi:MAG: hypothetical protein Q8R26_01900 [bacterium]|nr:hypothetical protein [bacterium]